MAILDFCKNPGGGNNRAYRSIPPNVVAINNGRELVNTVNRVNDNILDNLDDFNNHRCYPDGKCYDCDDDYNCYNDDDMNKRDLLSRRDMDNKYNNTTTTPYILDVINTGNFFKSGTIGNTVESGAVIDAFSSTIRENTGEYEKYSNMMEIYNTSILNTVNLGIGIGLSLLFIYKIR
jgi:hypothetical protein